MADHFAYAAIQAPVPNDAEWPDGFPNPRWPWQAPPTANGVIGNMPAAVKAQEDVNGDTFRFTHVVKSINQRLVANGLSASSLSTTAADRKMTRANVNTARNDIESLYSYYYTSAGATYANYNEVLEDIRDGNNNFFGIASGLVQWTSYKADRKTIRIAADMANDDEITPHVIYQLELALQELVNIGTSIFNGSVPSGDSDPIDVSNYTGVYASVSAWNSATDFSVKNNANNEKILTVTNPATTGNVALGSVEEIVLNSNSAPNEPTATIYGIAATTYTEDQHLGKWTATETE